MLDNSSIGQKLLVMFGGCPANRHGASFISQSYCPGRGDTCQRSGLNGTRRD